MIFWKLRFACNYSTRENLKSRYPKIALMYLLEKTKSSEAWLIPSLGEYLHEYLMKGFEKFYFFRILWAKNCPKMAAILDFWAFRANKISPPPKNIKGSIQLQTGADLYLNCQANVCAFSVELYSQLAKFLENTNLPGSIINLKVVALHSLNRNALIIPW